ncbi:DDB1- and CUL4-associated factor 17-like [Tropilaelaps mercedesae]|uniref:DDB1-and CUL4-associated factor 17-like n=1 Tax=Tropilaelaps mercedesae TaxID=418985 RepID=A0A1V9XQ72_9ACAR|nr:DDB1- and CUL4-associated factor 17-like [Tropilaelaps mercedesae]
MRPTIPLNNICALEARRLGPYSRRMKNMYRYQNRLMTNILASPNWVFVPILKERAIGAPEFLCPDKLFLENKRRCLSLRGPNCTPKQVYELPERGRVNGRKDTLLSILRAGMANPNPPPCDLLMVLTAVDTLEVRNLHTGEFLKSMNLATPASPKFHYHNMEHDQNYDQLIITSSRGGHKSEVLYFIVIFDICPEVKTAMRVVITRRVFGNSLSKVYLHDGILHAMYRSKREIRLYDFAQIRAVNELQMGNLEPILKIAELPRPVLVVPNADETFEAAGFPYHYVTRLPGTDTASVRTLDHQELARFEQSDFMTMDSVRFHSEDNGLIAHARNDMLRYYRIQPNDLAATAGPSNGASSKDNLPYTLQPVKDIRLIRKRKKRPQASGTTGDQQASHSESWAEDTSHQGADSPILLEDLDSGHMLSEEEFTRLLRAHGPIDEFRLAYDLLGGPPETRRNNSEDDLSSVGSLSPIIDVVGNDAHALPDGVYALRRSQRIQHLASLSDLPLYYYPDPDEDRFLFSDDFENELNVTVLLGREPGDRERRGVLQMFDDESGKLIRVMRFDTPLEPNVNYAVTLDLDVLMVVAQPEKGPTSHTSVYRLANIDSLPSEQSQRLLKLGPSQRHSMLIPREVSGLEALSLSSNHRYIADDSD